MRSYPQKRYLFHKPELDDVTKRAIYFRIRRGSLRKRYQKHLESIAVKATDLAKDDTNEKSLVPESTSVGNEDALEDKSLSSPKFGQDDPGIKSPTVDGESENNTQNPDSNISPVKTSKLLNQSLSSPSKTELSQQDLIKSEFQGENNSAEIERLAAAEEEILEKLADLRAEKRKIFGMIALNMKKKTEKKEKQLAAKRQDDIQGKHPTPGNDDEFGRNGHEADMHFEPSSEYRRSLSSTGYSSGRPMYRPPPSSRFEDGRPHLLPPRMHRYPGSDRDYWPRGRGRGGPRPYYSGSRH